MMNGDAQVAMYPQDRRSFVTQTVYRYAMETKNDQAPILRPLIDFILKEVIEPDIPWDKHRGDEDFFNSSLVERILIQCIRRVDRTRSLNYLSQEELHTVALPIFTDIIQDRWHCPVPFILC